jgi:protein SCO1
MNNNKFIKFLGLFALLILPTAIYIFFTTGKHNIISLPYFGEKAVVKNIVDGKEKIDTVYHKIPPFQFTNQLGEIVTQETFEGKIYVANFFFTTCPTICPKMSAQMLRAQQKLNDFEDVLFLSHTVNPEIDSVETLYEYAELVHANHSKWHFVTGDKTKIYEQGVKGYLVSTQEDALAPGGFLHSELMILIDEKGHIRGFYDGTSVTEVNRLIDEVKVLIADRQVDRKSRGKKEKVTIKKGNQ